VALNVTSALSGSGQAMRFKEFKKIMEGIESAVEDKEIEFALVRNGIKVMYENDAYVFDEKVQNAKVFSTQRKRWVASQFFDFNAIFIEGVSNLVLKGNIDFFDKALQRIILPRILLLGLSFFSAFIIFLPFSQMGVWFLSLFFVCCLGYMLAIPSSYFNLRTLNAAMRLPQAFYLMILAMMKSKGAAKKFIHTEHSTTVNHIK
jgi:cellulose synthase/poly-beta-1,6-N-acetylglucosamine synthase-like glycosyltransferase